MNSEKVYERNINLERLKLIITSRWLRPCLTGNLKLLTLPKPGSTNETPQSNFTDNESPPAKRLRSLCGRDDKVKKLEAVPSNDESKSQKTCDPSDCKTIPVSIQREPLEKNLPWIYSGDATPLSN